MNRFFIAAAGILCLCFVMQSCLKDQEEIFDDDASIRLQEAMEEAAEALVAAEYGWYLEMYPESSQSYGGWVHTFVFDGELVKARSELYGSDYEVESYYKMTNDDGPVLSFDTYNEVIHYLSTPTSSLYQAYGGEFEFIVLDVTTDIITLKGKKTGNIMYLRSLETTPENYLDAVAEMEDNIFFNALTGTIGGVSVDIGLDTDYRQMTFSYGEEDETTLAYTVTDKGVRLYSEITLGTDSLDEFYVDTDELTFFSPGSATISLESVFPDEWRPYKAFSGSYIFYYNSGEYSVNVILTSAGDNSSYVMSGLNPNYTVTLTYDRDQGCLEIFSQQVGTYGSNYVWFCVWDSNQGYLSWGTSYGMYLEWNQDEDNPVYEFVDIGTWSGYNVDSFILWQLDSDKSSVGGMNVSSWYTNGGYRFPGVTNLTKVD